MRRWSYGIEEGVGGGPGSGGTVGNVKLELLCLGHDAHVLFARRRHGPPKLPPHPVNCLVGSFPLQRARGEHGFLKGAQLGLDRFQPIARSSRHEQHAWLPAGVFSANKGQGGLVVGPGVLGRG